MLKAVTFDLGDTLIDYGPMHYRPMMKYGVRRAYEYLDSLGSAVALPPFRRFSWRMCSAARHVWYRSKFLVQDRDVQPTIRRVLAALGIALDQERERQVIRCFFAMLRQMAHPMPGAGDVLGALSERGLKLALISNSVLPPWLPDESLQEAGLLGYLPARFYSCAVGVKKPRRGIFERALAALGVAPAEALHVGDRYLTDIWGARRAGLVTCLKLGYRSVPLPPVRPDFVIRDLPDLLPVVDRLMNAS